MQVGQAYLFLAYERNVITFTHATKKAPTGATLVGKFSLEKQGKICLHLAYKVR